MSDQASSLRWLAKETLDRITRIANGQPNVLARMICVTSGKGGVGKTFVSVNLAALLVKAGKRVLLFDADLGLANVNVQLGMTVNSDLGRFANHEAPLEEVIARAKCGVDVLSGGSGLPELYSASPALVNRMLASLACVSRSYDAVVCDTGAGLSTVVQQILGRAHDIVLVTTTEPTSMTDAYAVIKHLSVQRKHACVELVVNAADERSAQATFRALDSATRCFLANTVKIKLAGHIPHDQAVKTSIIAQQPVVLKFPRARATRSLVQLAARLMSMWPQGRDAGVGP